MIRLTNQNGDAVMMNAAHIVSIVPSEAVTGGTVLNLSERAYAHCQESFDEVTALITGEAPTEPGLHAEMLAALKAMKEHADGLEQIIRTGVYESQERSNPDAWKHADEGAYNGEWASYRDQYDAVIAKAEGRG